MKKIILFIATCLAAATAVSAGSPVPPILQFRLVHETPSANTEPLPLIMHARDNYYTNTFNIEKNILLDQTAVKSAQAVTDSLGQSVIAITLTEPGAKTLADITKHHLHQRLAIIIDGQLCEAPVIQSEISGGEAQISGNFGEQGAKDLARKITAALVKE